MIALVIAGGSSLLPLAHDLLRAAVINLPYSSEPLAGCRGWKTAAEEIERFRSVFEQKLGEPIFLIGNRYQTAAIVAFYLAEPKAEDPGHPPVYIPESQNIENEFSFFPRNHEFLHPADKSAIYPLSTDQP